MSVIKVLTGTALYGNREAAIGALNALQHVKGQPFVCFFVDGDANDPAILFGVGTKDNSLPGPDTYKLLLDSVSVRKVALAVNSAADQPVTVGGTTAAMTFELADDIALTGAPTATTAEAGTNSIRIATTAFVQTAISNLGTLFRIRGIVTTLDLLDTELPTAKAGDVYLVGPNDDGEYEEYVYVAGTVNGFEKFGTTAVTVDLSGYVPNTRTVSVGNGLTGGGDLTEDRTISHQAQPATGTAAPADDPGLAIPKPIVSAVKIDTLGHVSSVTYSDYPDLFQVKVDEDDTDPDYLYEKLQSTGNMGTNYGVTFDSVTGGDGVPKITGTVNIGEINGGTF